MYVTIAHRKRRRRRRRSSRRERVWEGLEVRGGGGGVEEGER